MYLGLIMTPLIHSRSVYLAITFVLVATAASWAESAPTFNKDIAPILQVKCQACHRPGQIGSMSLLTYEETRPWASAIRKEVSLKRMPPFHAAGPIGYWKDDLRLQASEIETIVRWVDQGAVRGNPDDLPDPLGWTDSEWPLGEPDFVVEFPRQRVPANGRDLSMNLYSEYVFPEDTWLDAVQFDSRFNDTVHHAHIYMLPSGFEIPEKNKSRIVSVDIMEFQPIYTWFPGLTVEPLPDGVGMLVEKGSRFAIVAHFGPRTDEIKKEQLRLGVYRSNGTMKRHPSGAGSLMTDLTVPPHAANHIIRERSVITEDAWITHFWAHMHYRGKSAEYRLHYEDGRSETIFHLPQYSFDWQRYYYLAEPKRVPAGTELEIIAAWDNSEGNPLNPDPTQTLIWGPRTVDEMFGGGIKYTPVAELAEPIVVKDGVPVTDPSAQSAVK